jgi:hypothetical protein
MAEPLLLPALTDAEADCVARLREATRGQQTAVLLARFAIAMKGDYDRSAALLHGYLTHLVPLLRPESLRARHVQRFLERGVVALPGTCDSSGCPLVFYNAARHTKTRTDAERTDALKAILYLTERVQRHPGALRNGLALVANYAGVGHSDLDHTLHRLVLTTLQSRYPARVAHVYVVGPSTLTRALIAVSRVFMKAKLAERIVRAWVLCCAVLCCAVLWGRG